MKASLIGVMAQRLVRVLNPEFERVFVWSVAAAAILGGCASSPPMRFYTLSEVPAAGRAASSDAIRMGRVKIPAELDRSQLVQRIDANRLRIADEDRWAAPLEDMIRRVLAANLQTRAGGAATSASSPTLAVEIDEFTADSTCAVTLRAAWELKVSGTEAPSLSTGHEVIRTPASSSAPCTPGSIPMPMSQALAELADRVVAAKR